ncbi:uncharacterized protein Gasu_42820 [Galdieria sulphuraria]|uniref:Uncharacterized protein n=1 Tax=Galdieria sulphuraria TaxID=130081 RepID=M2XE72_GALSU|nr:uncharacterized protein Gasu_42820 [Galdieria sulphuraria]EME28282.1 hypothetical protein Gasu_42820 [Galdieria sulphuraria]|eukprot:XP_005704802.1 hypothetical protein Gasu_42820 [Galdieria sulphuraria]
MFVVSSGTVLIRKEERRTSGYHKPIVSGPSHLNFHKIFRTYYACDKLPFPEKEALPSSLDHYKKQAQPKFDNKAAKAAELIEVMETLENYRQRLYNELQVRTQQLGTEPEQQQVGSFWLKLDISLK